MAANIGGYISIGTNNLEAAREFYDKLFEQIGVKGFRGNERSYFYKFVKTDTYFAIFVPFDGKEATVGNGSMTGITFDSIEEVDQIYQIAIESGALDEGKPEQKMDTFYGGYIRDLDGNKLVFCKMG